MGRGAGIGGAIVAESAGEESMTVGEGAVAGPGVVMRVDDPGIGYGTEGTIGAVGGGIEWREYE